MTVVVFEALHVLRHIHIRAAARSGNRGGFNNYRLLMLKLFAVNKFYRFLPYPLFSRAVSVSTDTARREKQSRFSGIDATKYGGHSNDEESRDI